MAAVMTVAAYLILIILFLNFTTKLIKKKPTLKSFNLPPGSYGWPIFGGISSSWIKWDPEKLMKDIMEKHKSYVFKTSLMRERMVVMCGSAGNKFLFSNANKLVRVCWPRSVRRLLGSCVATSSCDEGKQMRKMVSCFMSPDAFTRLYIKTVDLDSQQHIKTH